MVYSSSLDLCSFFNVQAMSANSSQTDLYAVVNKKKKSSVPFVPGSSTHPVRRHDYEDMDDELPPKLPPPYQHSDSRPNGSVPPKLTYSVSE